MSADQVLAAASIGIAIVAMASSSILLVRQNQQLEHERNAMAILDAISRLTDPAAMVAFESLEGIDARYPDDEAILTRFDDSEDDRNLLLVAQYFETVACLARRKVLDASLIADAVGFMLRTRWETIRPFVLRLRRLRGNETIFEHFEWIARYSAWWRTSAPPLKNPNYDPGQFAGLKR